MRGNITILAGSAPGMYANLELMNPGANDSDNDGMPDGWEVANGLDPTDPWDALLDMDGDGLDLDQLDDGFLERLWTNLDEFRYVKNNHSGLQLDQPHASVTPMAMVLVMERSTSDFSTKKAPLVSLYRAVRVRLR